MGTTSWIVCKKPRVVLSSWVKMSQLYTNLMPGCLAYELRCTWQRLVGMNLINSEPQAPRLSKALWGWISLVQNHKCCAQLCLINSWCQREKLQYALANKPETAVQSSHLFSLGITWSIVTWHTHTILCRLYRLPCKSCYTFVQTRAYNLICLPSVCICV